MGLYKQYYYLIALLAFSPLAKLEAKTEYLRNDIPARSECSYKRISGPVLELLRKQSNSPWCYAYVSADLLSWELKERVSAADIALLYNNIGNNRSPNEELHSQVEKGGNPTEAMEYSMQTGMCLERTMPSQDYLFFEGTYAEDVQMLSMIRNIEKIKRNWDRTQDENYICKNTGGIREIFPLLSDLDIGEILMKSNQFSVVDAMWKKNCAAKRKFLSKPFDVITEKALGKTKQEARNILVRRLDQLLELHKPIGLSVRAGFIDLSDEEGLHAVSVVGRRLNPKTKECEYLIRDSNASVCPRTYKCDANGDIWASENLLHKNLEWLYYLREKK